MDHRTLIEVVGGVSFDAGSFSVSFVEDFGYLYTDQPINGIFSVSDFDTLNDTYIDIDLLSATGINTTDGYLPVEIRLYGDIYVEVESVPTFAGYSTTYRFSDAAIAQSTFYSSAITVASQETGDRILGAVKVTNDDYNRTYLPVSSLLSEDALLYGDSNEFRIIQSFESDTPAKVVGTEGDDYLTIQYKENVNNEHTLVGGAGDDTIDGSSSVAGPGNIFTGGEGQDEFQPFLGANHTDTITDFSPEDSILVGYLGPGAESGVIPIGTEASFEKRVVVDSDAAKTYLHFLGGAKLKLEGNFIGSTFVYSSFDGTITLKGLFDGGLNLVDFNALSSEDEVIALKKAGTSNALGGNDIVTLPAQVSAYQKYFDPETIDSAEVWTFEGGSGADHITGGAGDDSIIGDPDNTQFNDTLSGGNGWDTLIGGGGDDKLDGDQGSDKLYGGDGNDTFIGASGGDDELHGGEGQDTAKYELESQAFVISVNLFTEAYFGIGEYKLEVKTVSATDRIFIDVEIVEFKGKELDEATFSAVMATAQIVEDVASVVANIAFFATGGGPVAAKGIEVGTTIFLSTLKAGVAEDKGRTAFVELSVFAVDQLLGSVTEKILAKRFGKEQIDKLPPAVQNIVNGAIGDVEPLARLISNDIYSRIFGNDELTEDEKKIAIQNEMADLFQVGLQSYEQKLDSAFESFLKNYNIDVDNVEAEQQEEAFQPGDLQDIEVNVKAGITLAKDEPEKFEKTLSSFDGNYIIGFANSDTLVIQDAKFGQNALTVTYGSAILDVDVDGDGISDSTITLLGDFDDVEFVVQRDGADTKIRISDAVLVAGASAMSDSLFGTLKNNILEGLAGDDVLSGGKGDDTIYGGFGNDRGFGGLGNDFIFGEAGNDSLFGGDGGADTLIGGLGRDSISGDVGNDSLTGNEGNDTLRGGDGADTIRAGDGGDLVSGGVGSDTLLGGAGSDTLFGEDGNDSIVGGFGNDILGGGSGGDFFNAGDGADSINAGDGADHVLGGDAADTIVGGNGNDTLEGQRANDLIYGGDGNDSLLGFIGVDTLYGGAGSDLLNGGQGNDALFGDIGEDTIFGGDGGDLIEGGLGHDVLYSGLGSDTAIGGAGNDTVFGGAGADSLVGGEEDDTIVGGAGDDTLSGGTGADTFQFFANGGADTITDFDSIEDVLQLATTLWSGSLSVEQVVDQFATSSGSGTVLVFDNGEVITLNDLEIAELPDVIQFV